MRVITSNQINLSNQTRTVVPNSLTKTISAGFLLVCFVCCLIGEQVLSQEQLNSNLVEAHGPQKPVGSQEELSDALRYLEKLDKLDKYWSEVARPRFGRSEYKQPNYNNRRRLLTISRQQQPILFNENPLSDLLFQSAMEQKMRQYNSNEAY